MLFADMTKRFVFLGCIFLAGLYAQSQTATQEYLLKSINLYKICKFTSWPQQAVPADTFVIKMIGEPRSGENISIPADRRILDLPVTVKVVNSMDQIYPCHVLFICESEKQHLKEIISYALKNSILTIGDTENFAEQGVIVNFFIEDEVVKFKINVVSLNESKLKLHSRLLSLAELVNKRTY